MHLAFNEDGTLGNHVDEKNGIELYRFVIALKIPEEEFCFSKINLGDIHITSGDNKFILGIASAEGVIEDDEYRIYCRFEDIDDTIKEYGESEENPFNFKKSDWLNKDAKAEIHMPSEYEFIRGIIVILDWNSGSELNTIKATVEE